MIHIRKWIFMLVLTIIFLTTCEVHATSYVADDTVNVSSTYHDIFNNYFPESKKYTYFPYNCNNRTCYHGIDEDGNYLDISYITSGYNYTTQYTKGIDDSFSVQGVNVFVHEPSSSSVVSYILIFALVLFVVFSII